MAVSRGAGAEAAPAASLERVEALAHEVLRLRSLSRRHGELRTDLAQAEAQLKRLSVYSLLQFHSYLEKRMADPCAARCAQPALAELLEGLCAACGLESEDPEDELPPHSGRLATLERARQLLRDAHELTGRLRSLPSLPSACARERAPRLLRASYRRVRDPEVNRCYEALSGWLVAFYAYSSVADQVEPVALELERQELRLRQLTRARPAAATPAAERIPPSPAESAPAALGGSSEQAAGGDGLPPRPHRRTLARTDPPAPQLSPGASGGAQRRSPLAAGAISPARPRLLPQPPAEKLRPAPPPFPAGTLLQSIHARRAGSWSPVYRELDWAAAGGKKRELVERQRLRLGRGEPLAGSP